MPSRSCPPYICVPPYSTRNVSLIQSLLGTVIAVLISLSHPSFLPPYRFFPPGLSIPLFPSILQADMWSPTIVGIVGSQKQVSKLSKPQQLLERLSMLGRFGLGHKRTLDQLIAFTGIDLRNQVLLGDRCKELQVDQSSYSSLA